MASLNFDNPSRESKKLPTARIVWSAIVLQ